MTAAVLIILAEEYDGVHAAPNFGVVLALNLPWLLLPLLTLIRVARNHPFTESVPSPASPARPEGPRERPAVP